MIKKSKPTTFKQILARELFSVGDLMINESVDVSNKALHFSVTGNLPPKKKPRTAKLKAPQQKQRGLFSF